jgi:hypothetical protein
MEKFSVHFSSTSLKMIQIKPKLKLLDNNWFRYAVPNLININHIVWNILLEDRYDETNRHICIFLLETRHLREELSFQPSSQML